jgi:hypothetical protein
LPVLAKLNYKGGWRHGSRTEIYTAWDYLLNCFLTSKQEFLAEPINLIQIKTELLIGLKLEKGREEETAALSLGWDHKWIKQLHPSSPTVPYPKAPLTCTTAWVLHPGPTWLLLRVSMILGLQGSWGHSTKQVS